MSYRSDVAISISKNLEKRFDKLFQDNQITDYNKKHYKDGGIVYLFSSVKWYEDYQDIKAVMDLVNEICDKEQPEDESKAESITFQRIGQDTSDYDEFSNDYRFSLNFIRAFDTSEIK